MALIYTVAINSIVEVLSWGLIAFGETCFSIGEWSPTAKVLWSIFMAVILGLYLSYLYNNDLLHKMFRKRKITNQTSYPSEWYGTFSETPSYIVLHLIDRRRIMGWPSEWPSSPKNGHFILENAAWLDENDEKHPIELNNVEKIMLDVTNINMVEFMKPTEVNHES